jgi:hypothetical protein
MRTEYNYPPRNPIRQKAVVCALLLCAVPPVNTFGQQSAPPKQIPQRIIYWQMFKHVNFLEQQATAAVQLGQDPNPLRNFYQNSAKLTDAETALLKQSASTAAAAVQSVEQQIHAVVLQYQAQNASLKPSGKWPAPPPQLATLQAQHDKAITDQVAALQSGFGTARFQQFDAFVQTFFAPHIQVGAVVPPPPPSDPSKPRGPLQPTK